MAFAGFLRTLPAPSSTLGGFVCLLNEDWFTQADVNALDGTTFINGGGSLRLYTDATKTTRLPVHVIEFVTGVTPSIAVFTRLPSYASGDTIWVESDAVAVTQPAADSTYGSQNVYQDYEARYEFETPSFLDSTANALDLDQLNGTPTSVDGGIAGNQINLQNNDSAFRNSVTALNDTTQLTVSGWINLIDQAGDRVLLGQRDNTGGNPGFELFFDANVFGSPEVNTFNLGVSDGSNAASVNGVTNAASIGLHHVVVTFQGSNSSGLKLYIDGVEDANSGASTISVPTTGAPNSALGVGSIRGSARDVAECDIDTVGVRLDILPSDYIASEYANQNSPSTFGVSSGWTTGGAIILSPSSVVSEEKFGVPSIQNLLATIQVPSIFSEEKFGNPVVSAGITLITPEGIVSEEKLGEPDVLGSLVIICTGIESQEKFGEPVLDLVLQQIFPDGINSMESFGTPVVIGGDAIVIPVTDRATYDKIALYLKSLGFKGQCNDIIVNWLISEGYTGEFNDIWFRYLRDQGFIGSESDMFTNWRKG